TRTPARTSSRSSGPTSSAPIPSSSISSTSPGTRTRPTPRSAASTTHPNRAVPSSGSSAAATPGAPAAARGSHFSTRSHTGTIVGVIGGYEEGGNTPSVSYSVRFGAAVQSLYQQAIATPTPSPSG